MPQVQEEARHAIASMLERAGMSDRIKSVMGLIGRYESLFQLPTRIVQETERGEFETVCTRHHVSSVQTWNYGCCSCIMGFDIACKTGSYAMHDCMWLQTVCRYRWLF